MSQSNKMSVMQLTILTAVNMMGSGIIMLPTKLAPGKRAFYRILAGYRSGLHVPGLCICQMRHVQ